MKRTLLVVLLLVGLVGCVARMNRVMSSWVGNSYGNVIAAWGPPDQVLDDGSGGKILVYTRVRSYTAPGTATTQTSGTAAANGSRSEEHTSELQSLRHLVCRLLLEKKKTNKSLRVCFGRTVSYAGYGRKQRTL